MAKDKKDKKKAIVVDPNIIDYYALYHLTRGADSKEIGKELRKKQGEIKQKMSAGALNSDEVNKKLMEQDKLIAAAIRIFKSEEKLQEYNAMLDAAIASGTLNTEAQEAAESALEEIERLFLNSNYAAVIKRCRASLAENGANSKLYSWLAQSYFMSGQGDATIATVEDYVKAFPMEGTALDLGVRYYIQVRNDFNKAQEYMNRILEIDESSPLAALDQSYIYLAENNLDMAFQVIDGYVAAHPSDMDFRRDSAYDIIGFCARMYHSVDGSDALFLTSAEEQATCKKLADKAASIYQDPDIQTYVDYTNYMGKIEFNEDNKSIIGWSIFAGVVYLIGAVIAVGATANTRSSISSAIGPMLFLILLAAACFVIGGGLIKVSKRPYWQIYKYELTGEREPMEKTFITLGTLLSGYIKWAFRAGWKLFKLAFHIGLGG